MTIYTSEKVMPYVYMGIHKVTGEFYIGSRTTPKQCLPSHQDIHKYRTSSKKVKPIFDEFDWVIVAEFLDPVSAYEFEQNLIYENWNNPLRLNGQYRINAAAVFSSAGVTRSPTHRAAIKKAQTGRSSTDSQKQHARQNMQALKTIRVSCLCCRKERNLPNHTIHLKGSTKRGVPLPQHKRESLHRRLQEVNTTCGTCKSVYTVVIGEIVYLCYDLWGFFKGHGISPPTGRKRYITVDTGIKHRGGKLLSPLPPHLSCLPVI